MVFASIDTTTELQKLADMADKIMNVATPTVSTIASGGSSSEVSELCQEVSHLAELLASLTTRYSRPCNRNRSRFRPNHPQSHAPSSSSSLKTHSVGIRALANVKTLWLDLPATSVAGYLQSHLFFVKVVLGTGRLTIARAIGQIFLSGGRRT